MPTLGYVRAGTATLLIAGVSAVAQAQITQTEYAARREAVAARIDSGIFFLAGAREPLDHYPPFKQLAPFRYLTGFLAPDAALVMVRRGGHTTATLYIQPPDARREFYTGERMTPEAITRETGMTAERNDRLDADLDALARTELPLWVASDAESDEFIADDSLSFGNAVVRRLRAVHPSLEVRSATQMLDSIRAKKSPAEVALLEHAAVISSLGHKAVLAEIAPGKSEADVQAVMELTFRKSGGDGTPAYSSIVGSGPNGTTLHYDHDDRVMKAGEVIVMDCATSYQGYAADITRTVPVSGTFTADQRAVYQIVRDAQAAGERLVKPGVTAAAERDSIKDIIVAGLARLHLIDSAAAVIDAPKGFCGADDTCPQWRLFAPHGPSHGLGLDVHDPAQFYYGDRTFAVGDAFTIEPGIYVKADILSILPDTPRNRAYAQRVRAAVERYANIGVRIEDDYVVTANGVHRLSVAPREASEIESLMRRTVQ
jgi:Xaa-Pro aminopeptidase